MALTTKGMLCVTGIVFFLILLYTGGVWMKRGNFTRSPENSTTAFTHPGQEFPDNTTVTTKKPVNVFPKNVSATPKRHLKGIPPRKATSAREPLKEAPAKSFAQNGPLPKASYPDWFTDAWDRSPATKYGAFVDDKPLFPSFPHCKSDTRKNVTRVSFIEPQQYVPQSKNPCWYKDPIRKRGFRCLPYFYIAGVAKCGTTDLYRRLRYHPQVMRGTLKEYHFWDRERFGNVEILDTGETIVHRKPWSFEHYLGLITGDGDLREVEEEVAEGGNSSKLFGDGSPSYMWDILNWDLLEGNEGCAEPRVVIGQHIRHVHPGSKMILIFRHPTPRLYSRFLSRLWRTPYLNGSTSKTFHDYVVKGVEMYKDCFKKYSIRQCAYNYTTFDDAVIRLVEGMYPIFVADWLRIWPRDQMLILRTEDFAVDLEATMLKAFDFLGVDTMSKDDYDRVMEHPLSNVGTQYGNLGPMLPETVKILDEFYQPFVNKFAEILQDSRFLWHDVYPPEQKPSEAEDTKPIVKMEVKAASRSLLTTTLEAQSPWLRKDAVQHLKALPHWAYLVMALDSEENDDEPNNGNWEDDYDDGVTRKHNRRKEKREESLGNDKRTKEKDDKNNTVNKGPPPGWVSELLYQSSDTKNNEANKERPGRIEAPLGMPIKKARYPPWFWKAWSRSSTSRLGDLFFGEKPLVPPCATKSRSSSKPNPFNIPEPHEYLSISKNPCWFQNPVLRKGFHCLPYYYIVGVSNCGTADLNRRLRHHPDVMKGVLKEYHWWNRGRFGDIYSGDLYDHTDDLRGIRIPFKEYTELITGRLGMMTVLEELNSTGISTTVFGDHSPSYFNDVKLWPLVEGNQGCDEPRVTLGHTIHHMTPKAKIILVVRHPTPRLYTTFLSRLPDNTNLRGSAASFAFHRLVTQSVAMYKDCFERWSIRQCAYNTTLYLKDKVRLWEGMYSVFLMDWLRVFPRSQIHVIRYRDLIRDTARIISNTFRFLDLPPLNVTLLRGVAADKWLERREQHELRRFYGSMVPETVDMLNDFYEPFVDKFAEMLNDERFLWRDIDHL